MNPSSNRIRCHFSVKKIDTKKHTCATKKEIQCKKKDIGYNQQMNMLYFIDMSDFLSDET